MSPPPFLSREVLVRLRVHEVAYLGGRLNQHWLVQSKAKGTRLVLRRWAPEWASASSIGYELRLLSRLSELGWPVPYAVEAPIDCEGYVWSLAPFLDGESPSADNPPKEQRERGRLLARLHADLVQLEGFGQRGQWRRCEQIVSDETLDAILSKHEAQYPEAVHIVRWHLERARERIGEISPETWPGQLVHGDFAPWNLRFQNGRLSGILDFELAHIDHRIGDFALAWRGKYDEVVHGYNEVAPLSPQEWQLLTPLWWAFLIEEACRAFRDGRGADEWSLNKLLQRSPLMGRDSAKYHT